MYQLCYRFVGNHEDASDLAQDVFIRAYRGLRKFKGQASLGTWLYRIAVNVSPEQGRREDAEAGARSIRCCAASDERDGVARGERDRCRCCAASAPGRCARRSRGCRRSSAPRSILRVYHELPHEQIAGILGSSVGAVKANFFHALNNLKKLMS